MEDVELLDYACRNFQNTNYPEALEALVLAHSKGIEKEWVIKNIYSCYMSGNEEAFQKAYECSGMGNKTPYNDCLLDFVPYRDGEYFIYDKEWNIFRGIFSSQKMAHDKIDQNMKVSEFSAAAIAMDWDWRTEGSILMASKERNIYAVCQDMQRACSFCKIPELKIYWKNLMLFPDFDDFQNYFHANTGVYLPRILYGNNEDAIILKEIIDKEHLYRLTPEGRDVSNVLLTIGIPTHNRGNLLLKRLENLCNMVYDAEIEVVISRNGTTEYQQAYEPVKDISDARIHYTDWKKEIRAVDNWHHVVEQAHGKYVLFVSDEDDVCLDALEHYLRLLKDHPEASLVRAKTASQNQTQMKCYAKKGLNAFEQVFLKQNYLSGLIVRKEDFLQEDFLHLHKELETNIFLIYYPHELWCAILSQKGDYIGEPVTLIWEGESANEIGVDLSVEKLALPEYATYEARILQFYGIIDLVRWLMGNNSLGIVIGVNLAIRKTQYLCSMARQLGYDPKHFEEWIVRFYHAGTEAINSFQLEIEYATDLLAQLKVICINALKEYSTGKTFIEEELNL